MNKSEFRRFEYFRYIENDYSNKNKNGEIIYNWFYERRIENNGTKNCKILSMGINKIFL